LANYKNGKMSILDIKAVDEKVDGIKKVGWVKFGRIFGPDWRM
jgi:hypothetical protein